MWYTDWWQREPREAQADMEETDREGLPGVEAHNSWPSRKEHLEIRCEILLSVQLRGPTDVDDAPAC